jgi:hypothetical protein
MSTSSSLITATGSVGPADAELAPNTPEITNAKSAIPITKIKKMDRCLIFPKTAIVAIFS